MTEMTKIDTRRLAITTEASLQRSIPVPDVIVDDSRNSLITPFGYATLKDRYLVGDETPQDRFANCVRYYANDSEHAQRMYEYMSKLWCIGATPVVSNGGTTKGNLISCYLNAVDDSLEGIIGQWQENAWLGAKGGGLGTYYGKVRGIGERAGVNGKTSGVMSFVKVNDSIVSCISQGSNRRAAGAIYLDINHPEIDTFIDMRQEIGGDPTRKAPNLHHGVLIPDAFYDTLAREDDSWDLISPLTGKTVETVSARALFRKILETRVATGEPYIINIDTVNRSIPEHHKKSGLTVTTSNLCVAPETRLLIINGYREIRDIAGSDQLVWNGKRWALARVEKTGEMQKLVKVILSNGVELSVTPYHRFKLQIGYGNWNTNQRIVEARDLVPGDKLVKTDLPVVEGGYQLDSEEAYRNGFYSADGTNDQYGNPRVYLYGEKKNLLNVFSSMEPNRVCIDEDNGSRHTVYFNKQQMLPKFTVPFEANIKGRLDWLAGYLDGDGTVARNGTNESIQVCSINKKFLHDVRLLLTTLGINSHIAKNFDAGMRQLPDGNGNSKEYFCQEVFRLCISSGDVQRLLNMGINFRRLDITRRDVQRDAHQFIYVIDVVDEGRYDDTYCFNEPTEHMGIFEGVPTMNCCEITLPTGIDHHGRKRTAVCALFQLNLEKWDEWSENEQFLLDIAYFMDNVLQDFIDNAGEHFINARYSASRERSIGIGTMGFHSFLQSKMIPFDSAMAKVWNLRFFKHIKEHLDKASVRLAEERGACPDAAEHGIMERFSNKTAIAPTASVSIIAGTSPGCDPEAANIFTQKTLDGTFEVRNKYLEKILITKGKNTKEVWASIIDHLGSVQHLDFLEQKEKDCFKTSLEIDPRWFIEHASDRQPFVDQSQSLNIFIPPDIDKYDLLWLHLLAHRKGVKSLYYLRSVSSQRADSTTGISRNVISFKSEGRTDYEECLACQ